MRKMLLSVGVMSGLTVALANVGAGDALGVQNQKKSDVARLLKELNDPNEKVLRAAMDSLEKVGRTNITEILVEFDTGNKKTRPAIASILGRIRHSAIKDKQPEFSAVIEDVLVSAMADPDNDVFGAACYALTGKQPRSKKAIPVLISLLSKQKHQQPVDFRFWNTYRGLEAFGPEQPQPFPLCSR